MSSPVGHSVEDMAVALAKLKGITVDDALKFLGGSGFATKAQWGLIDQLGGAKAQLAKNAAGNPTIGAKVAKFAGGKTARNLLRAIPGLSTALVALDAADVVTGDESLGNKLMDTAGMAIGGTLGAIGGPVGSAAGASTGKFVSDGLQYLFGDKKPPEQRRMEEALAMLQGGRY